MYNPVDINRIDRQIEDLQRMRANYQNMLNNNPPINNIITTQPSVKPLFEAKFTNENPADILVQNKTAFIDLKNNKLTIKEVDGDVKEFAIIPPMDEKDIRIQQLENEINNLKQNYLNLQLNTNPQPINNPSSADPTYVNSTNTIDPNSIVQTQTTNNNTSLEPIIYTEKDNGTNYNITQKQSLADKLSSKLNLKRE